MRLRLLIVMTLAICAGCASVESQKNPATGDGLFYYMPKKDVVLTVVIEAGKDPAVSIGVSESYPDLSSIYRLTYTSNLVGKNEMKIGVSESGLLTSATSKTTSGVTQALVNLAESAGAIQGLGAPPGTVQKCPAGKHMVSIDVTDASVGTITGSLCNVNYEVTALLPAGTSKVFGTATSETKSAGFFYRQMLPYKVQLANGTGQAKTEVVFSPSGSATKFLPISRTLFANNQADVTFIAGVPKEYSQSADGELIGLLKLPADVIGAYFKAIGGVFDAFKSRDDKNVAALQAELALELAKQKSAACLEAIVKKDKDLTSSLGCAK